MFIWTTKTRLIRIDKGRLKFRDDIDLLVEILLKMEINLQQTFDVEKVKNVKQTN